jgi:uncharacterized membrane protein YfcA
MEMPWVEVAKMLVVGVSAGILSGMFGIGGGLVIVPILIVFFGFDPKIAVGTSLFALLLPTGLLGAVEYYRRGELRMLPGLLIAIGLFCGAYFGARITGAISAATMKRAYGVFLILVAIYFFWSSSPDRGKVPAPSEVMPDPKVTELGPGAPSQPVH